MENQTRVQPQQRDPGEGKAPAPVSPSVSAEAAVAAGSGPAGARPGAPADYGGMDHPAPALPGRLLAGTAATYVHGEFDEADLAAARRFPGHEHLAGLRDLPDDAMIPRRSEFREHVPGRWHASTPQDLRRVIREVIEDLGLGLDPADLEEDIAHEAEHAAAAQALGCASRLFFRAAPLMAGAPDGAWYAVPGHVCTSPGPLPKLALAAITAAPSWLSDDDLADLRLMGYQDADDVARRIRKSGKRLPMPKSARPARAWLTHRLRRSPGL